jgi:2-polyprenyl-3-methyl-5-hydroxy-6-metoxy-1,4-benzoquinol methylase
MTIVRADAHEAEIESIRAYWNAHIHDVEVSSSPHGSEAFFRDLDAYRFDKLAYLEPVLCPARFRGKQALEVGCGIGTDLVRIARTGASVTGVDLAEASIDLARQNFAIHGLPADLRVMNAERLEFDDEAFDIAYAHGVLQYTARASAVVGELHRVLRRGGELIAMVYNRYSWLNALSKVMKVELEHADAPVLNTYSIAEVRRLFGQYVDVRIVPDRLPVRTRLQRGWKAVAYNEAFVRICDALPKSLLRPVGWHIMVYARKA